MERQGAWESVVVLAGLWSTATVSPKALTLFLCLSFLLGDGSNTDLLNHFFSPTTVVHSFQLPCLHLVKKDPLYLLPELNSQLNCLARPRHHRISEKAY